MMDRCGGSILGRGSGCQVYVGIGVKQTSFASWLKNWHLMSFSEEFFPQEARQGYGQCQGQHQEPSLFVGVCRPESISPLCRILNADVVLLCCYGPSFQRPGEPFPSPLSTHHPPDLCWEDSQLGQLLRVQRWRRWLSSPPGATRSHCLHVEFNRNSFPKMVLG